MSGCSKCRTVAVYFVGIGGSLLLMAGMVGLMRHYAKTPPASATRAEERRKALNDVLHATKTELEQYGIIDPAKGLIRLPIDRAMELVIAGSKDPAAFRSNLLARVDKANPPPPPKPPEQPSQFE